MGGLAVVAVGDWWVSRAIKGVDLDLKRLVSFEGDGADRLRLGLGLGYARCVVPVRCVQQPLRAQRRRGSQSLCLWK